jgi:hypothetical protein
MVMALRIVSITSLLFAAVFSADALAQQICGPAPIADVVIMVDRSGSLEDGPEFQVQKNNAKRVLDLFSQNFPRPRVALGSFAVEWTDPRARIESSGGFTAHLTGDYGSSQGNGTRLYQLIDLIKGPHGRTDISAALYTAQAELELNATSLNRYIILVTDGIPTEPGCPYSCLCADSTAAANAAAAVIEAAGTKIMVVRYGDMYICNPPQVFDFVSNQLASRPDFYFEATAEGGGIAQLYEKITSYPPCDDGDACTVDTCNNETGRCEFNGVDSDGDGSLDCRDLCPDDSGKADPGQCGCGVPDLDSDHDGTADCLDACSLDPAKTSPGECGCGVPEVDANGDGILDCKCTTYNIQEGGEDLFIGPEKLRLYAKSTLDRLTAGAKKTGDAALGRRLQQSWKRADKKIKKLIKQCTQTLDQLPQVMLICPNSPLCKAVDNTEHIEVYIKAVRFLGGAVIRVLSRATRPVFPTVAQAKAHTKEYGIAVRTATAGLIEKAQTLPRTASFCAA